MKNSLILATVIAAAALAACGDKKAEAPAAPAAETPAPAADAPAAPAAEAPAAPAADADAAKANADAATGAATAK